MRVREEGASSPLIKGALCLVLYGVIVLGTVLIAFVENRWLLWCD